MTPQSLERLRQLKQVEALRKRRPPWSEVQEVVGLSRASYYRWKGRLKEQGLTGLKPRSKRPQRLRGKVHWTPELLAQVEGLRKENPTWGRWPIWLSLRKAGYTLSERTVGRILVYLEGQGRVERCPFPIRAVQVDGGSEFMAAFEEGCQALGIRLFVLPPRSPKLNGHVERIQRIFRDEFCRPLPTRVGEIQAELEDYLAYYNGHRPHMALEGLAPLEFLAKLQAESVPLESQMC